MRLDELTKFGEQTKLEYEDLEEKVDIKFAEVLRKAREDYKDVKHQLRAKRNEDFDQIEAQIMKLELDIKTKQEKNVLDDVAMNIAQGTNLRQLPQASADIEATENNDGNKKDDIEYSSDFRGAACTNNLIGSIVRMKRLKDSCDSQNNQDSNNSFGFIDQPLTNLCSLTATLVKEIQPGYRCSRFVKLGDRFVFLCDNEIRIDTLDGKKLRTIEFRQINRIQSIQELSLGLALAATNGLYIGDLDGYLDGNIKSKIMDGDICDVSVMEDTLYALDNGRSKVCILKQSEDKKTYFKQNEFHIPGYFQHGSNTIQVTTDHVYVALYGRSTIYQYSHKGILLAKFQKCNNAIGKNLFQPKLCGASTDGSLLVLRDTDNPRVIILTADGQWRSLAITEAAYPRDAWVEDNNVWVIDGYNRSCIHFILESIK